MSTNRPINIYSEKIDKTNFMYIKLLDYLNGIPLSEEEKNIVILHYFCCFIRNEYNDELMKHIIENYFQILSIVDLIKYQKGVYRIFYVIEKENEQLIDKTLCNQNITISKHFIVYKELEYILYVVEKIINCNFDENISEFVNNNDEKLIFTNLNQSIHVLLIPYSSCGYLFGNYHIDASFLGNPESPWPWGSKGILEQKKEIRGNKGYRIDLNCGFRSSWEANIARLLLYKKIEFFYEDVEKSLVYTNRSGYGTKMGIYLPDFSLTDGTIIEVKGAWDNRSLCKMRDVSEDFPDSKIIYIDSDSYYCIQEKYMQIIPEWEYSKVSSSLINIVVTGINRSERKKNVIKLNKDEKLVLCREKDNIYDKNAIAVKDSVNNMLGYIAKEYSLFLAPKIDMGFKYELYLNEIQDKILNCKLKLLNRNEIIIPSIFQ